MIKRRGKLKEKNMHRLQVKISDSTYQALRGFAPHYGAGAIIERMVEKELARREKKATAAASAQGPRTQS